MATASCATQCLCKPTTSFSDKKSQTAIGVLNPAFNDMFNDNVVINELHYGESSPLPYFTKVEPLTTDVNGLTYIQVDRNCATDNTNRADNAQDIDHMSCVNAISPTKLGVMIKSKSKVRAYSLWFLLWCIIVVSFAGITASIACIVWLETYREIHFIQAQIVNLTDADSLLFTTTPATEQLVIVTTDDI